MRILVEMTHPADVHFFRWAVHELQQRGHQVHVTARGKDCELDLLERFGIEHEVLSSPQTGAFRLFRELVSRDLALCRAVRRFKPDVMTALVGTCASHAGWLTRTPTVIWEDTEDAALSLALTTPWAARIMTPTCYWRHLGPRQVRFQGTKELAYLHPNRFRPDPAVLADADVSPEEPYAVVRLVAWQASHDRGQHGIPPGQLADFLQELSRLIRVFVTSETPLPSDLEPYRLPVPTYRLHDLLAFASLYVGEGTTTASEAAVLGVPTILVSTRWLGYLRMLRQDYGLLLTARTVDRALALARSLLAQPDLKQRWQRKRASLLADCDDVTDLVVKTVLRAAGKAARPL